MSNQNLQLFRLRPALFPGPRPHLPLGRHLVENQVITPDQLVRALQMQLRLGAPIGEILISEGWAKRLDVQNALAQQNNLQTVDFVLQPPDPDLGATMSEQFWLKHRVIPWMRLGNTILVATARPDRFERTRIALGDKFGDVLPVLAADSQIATAIARQFAQPLAKAAESRVCAEMSCRTWHGRKRFVLLVILACLLLAMPIAPLLALGFLSFVAIATLAMFATLKLTAFVTHLRTKDPCPPDPAPELTRLPKVSVIVPLFRENEIATTLVQRLTRMTYPKVLLEVLLVLEEHDAVTRQALDETDLPPWIRVIEVPAYGGLTTKPRAMNYALDFCRGDIIGVWDAEDAPAADQIETVVQKFAESPEDVVCLQGILDYYNPRTNWISRCFTIEYSAWFRIVLPGIARMGLVVPLGGTTLFFKRDKLEELGGWDAHNVTEDADLGVRLCRAGYRTELIDTVTYEEANYRVWPWIKQRSRWLKGFMVTYLVHMRRPRRLLCDLGLKRFLGFQAFFVGTLCQFLLAPVLWSFWLVIFGLGHPVQALVPSPVVYGLTGLFILTEVLSLAIALTAVSRPERRFLMAWAPFMMFYFPLGVIAAYKALFELIVRPFFWDKTQHGQAVAETTPG